MRNKLKNTARIILNKLLKPIFTSVILATLISCGTNKSATSESKVNSKLNSEYKESRKSFSGKLDSIQYVQMIQVLEKELDTKIPEKKTILINYVQYGSNCIYARFNANETSKMINKGIKISNTIASENDILDFFVFTEDAFYNNLYNEDNDYKLDSGFFYNNVFTLHENCRAFIIIKHNGEFLKYYGEDYFDQVKSFLEDNY